MIDAQDRNTLLSALQVLGPEIGKSYHHDPLAKKIIEAYRFYQKCPDDPCAFALLREVVTDYQRVVSTLEKEETKSLDRSVQQDIHGMWGFWSEDRSEFYSGFKSEAEAQRMIRLYAEEPEAKESRLFELHLVWEENGLKGLLERPRDCLIECILWSDVIWERFHLTVEEMTDSNRAKFIEGLFIEDEIINMILDDGDMEPEITYQAPLEKNYSPAPDSSS